MDDDHKKARDFTKNREEHPRVASWRQDGLWIIVLSMGGRNFCTYIGVPVDHPIAGFDYDLLPIDCHGGLTFAGEGDGKYRPEGYYWYGWDYGHAGDYSWFGDGSKIFEGDKDWTLKEVKDDAWNTIYDFTKLRDLAEGLTKKADRSHK